MYMAGRITPSFQEDARRMLVHGRAEGTDGQRINASTFNVKWRVLESTKTE